jgi:hypothetical protein
VRLYLRSADRRPDPPPLETNDRAVVRFGIAAWTVLLVVALVLYPQLEEQGRGWWVWTPVVAIMLGCYGLWYLHRRAGGLSSGPSSGPSSGLSSGSSSKPSSGSSSTDREHADREHR